MTESILVTGAFGLVGTATVEKLSIDGRRVTATDLDTLANRKKADTLTGAQVRWADLTDEQSVATLLSEIRPTVIVHLAAMIPPMCYARPDVARRVNVDATRSLVYAATSLRKRPRLVLASSVAVYGPRNPHLLSTDLTADTATSPMDIYGTQKWLAEQIVRDSLLEWVVLRLGGVLTAAPRFDLDLDTLYFEGLLPSDGRIHTVDVRDVARAFVAATTADVVGETLMIGGDPSHRLTQADVGHATTAAMGLKSVLPPARRGDPQSEDGWFATDWMDTERSQEALDFQQISFTQLMADTRRLTGRRRPLLRLFAPLARAYFKRKGAYRNAPGTFADPWERVTNRWGQFRTADAAAIEGRQRPDESSA
ncbi:NAD-dependent epimerase/dehydratase family protein [Mycobacteroides abscessus]|uniref:NAD-dependent epimerase/dehydratase family protein n=2 Tax=Mycobacteroides abscessus TaxID=36809 RepID=UPI0009A7F95A|nr:NAD(P)-dependent oxidoreductase [Mycobacteroides abscessus]MDO3333960.1 NAD(P)-dependent oxidoreductase [Mycobacteroides abscessus subsp. bolletii]QSM91468.1 NAD(P)-dependent oxidoreductase [Mycobacteroides abscessus subsp. bolletii]SKS86145.1 NAD-dependent epimerase/dehydratase [Mycobacteroides abscessus subsp. bolletii]SKT10025.1 NAD-dependent epimerase/dehydratase [Mycobacteroides abscessus subsp. bolletii]SLD07129.1 NAD-dependent epimerase/dehydratase [Mycobacteroides abscessus subsp. b